MFNPGSRQILVNVQRADLGRHFDGMATSRELGYLIPGVILIRVDLIPIELTKEAKQDADH